MKNYKIIFDGRVQGVGFRFQAKQIADNLGLNGYVKNLSNGKVELSINSDIDSLYKLLEKIENLRFVNVENKYIEVSEQLIDYKDFKIIY